MGGAAYKKFHSLWDGISGKGLYTALTILFEPLLQTFTPNEVSSLFLIDALGKHIHGFVWHFPGNSQKHTGNWKKVWIIK